MPKAVQPRTHKERAQPASRARLGLLEKHSDYVQRARDKQRKQARLTALKVRAQYKNPNEFAFGMLRAKTGQDGTHRQDGQCLTTDVVKLLKSQDLGYVRMMQKVNQGKLDKIVGGVPAAMSKRTKFYDSEDEEEILEGAEILEGGKSGKRGNGASSKQTMPEGAEVKVRRERLAQLKIAERQLESQKHLMGKGRRRKVGVDKHGLAIFKWDPIRKK